MAAIHELLAGENTQPRGQIGSEKNVDSSGSYWFMAHENYILILRV